MSFKKQRRCSKFEHHEGAPPVAKSDEKPPMENGDIVLTNVVSGISSPFFALGLSVCFIVFDVGRGSGDCGGAYLEHLHLLLLAWLVTSSTYNCVG